MNRRAMPGKSMRQRTRTVLAALALVGVPGSATAQIPLSCPTHWYLGNLPGDTDKPDWSEQAQGIANDGEHWFFTRDTRLFKYDANWREVDGDDVGKLLGGGVGFPPELIDPPGDAFDAVDHFGDLDHYAGYLFVPFENNHPDFFGGPCPQFFTCEHTPPYAIIGAFRASDLEFVDWVDVTKPEPDPERKTKAGWVAIDPVTRLLYTSGNTIVAGTPLERYEVDVSKIENGIQGDFLTRTTDAAVQETFGGEIPGQFTYMQGGVFTPWGDLYLVAGKAGESIGSTRGGIHLFRPTADGNAFRRVVSSFAQLGDPPFFAYEYDPGSTGLGEEPEGIDWWNRDNVPGSRYAGQLHAILLDNQIGDDAIWLKHYRVDYQCIPADTDTDGDGVSDRDEVYVHGTHPLLGDTDGDGVDDVVDNCPHRANASQADLDGDGAGDRCDPDVDGDGQSNRDESACGSDDQDASSMSPDLDGDREPDCLDGDDDADGVADADDRCAGTIVPDPVIPRSGSLKSNRYTLLDDDLVFDRQTTGVGDSPAYSTLDTGGCNASQIADALRLGKAHYDYGITRSVLEGWIGTLP